MLLNFIPRETILFNGRDTPRISSQVKHLIDERNAAYKNYLKNNKSNQSFAMLQSCQG